MRTLLLNGCSFAEFWHVSDELMQFFGCTDLRNIGKAGTSFQRTCRTTVEWIAQNGSPHFILIPITFSHRWELALNKKEDYIDGSWMPLQNSNYLGEDFILQDTSINDVKNLCDDYYKIIPNIKTYWDKLFTEIIMLAGFLDNRNIPYLMWDMCNGFDKKHLTGNRAKYKAFEKIKLIEDNKRIIDIWNFCGNRYMRSKMSADSQKKTPKYAYHHQPTELKELEKYIISYAKSIDQ